MAFGTPTSIGNAGHASGTTLVLTTTATVSAGSLIVVVVEERTNQAPGGSLVDSGASNSYVGTTGISLAATQSNGWVRMFYVKNASALSSGSTITYTPGGTANPVCMSAFFVTGADTSAPLDTTVTASATGTGTTPSVTSGSPAAAGELFLGVLGSRGSSGTFTQDTGVAWATPPTEGTSGTGNGAARVNGGVFVNTGTGTLTYAPTTTVSGAYAVLIFGFKVAGGTDTTVNLTGVAATGQVGDFTINADNTTALTGVAATGHVGDFTLAIGPGVPLTGVSATAQVGTFGIRADNKFTIVGVSAEAAAGDFGFNPPPPSAGTGVAIYPGITGIDGVAT